MTPSSYALPLDAIRSIAHDCGYTQVKHNETSKVIIFQKNGTKINVYYTTGTVGTCINHPRQGKTQLFRRRVSLDTLRDIFENPRIHTGTGYQLQKNMVWKPVPNERIVDASVENMEPECDLARRWRFVCYSTGLCDDEQVETIVKFCKLWDELEFERGADHKNMKDRRDGSCCVLAGCLLDVAKQHHGAIKAIVWNKDSDERYELDIETACNCICGDGLVFKRTFQEKIAKARRLLVSLDPHVRREVITWFDGRTSVGSKIVGKNGKWWSRDDVDAIHREYSLQYYPSKWGLCACHGVC